MAKYQLGEQGHSTPEGKFLEPFSVQVFPDDYQPSLKWRPMDKAAEKALDDLIELKKSTHQARLSQKPAAPEFKRLPLTKEPVAAPEPESRPDPNTLAGHAKASAHHAKGHHLRKADEEKL